VGAANVELPVARRHGLLNRLATDRPRVPPAPSLASEGIDQVHSATPLPIGTRLGTFEVTGVLHRDLSGIVYAGEDRSSPGKVAIKEYLPATLSDRMASGKVGLRSLRYKASFQEGKERFLSNGRMLAALDEPALIRVIRCWKQNGSAYMAMPLYEGQTLSDLLRVSARPGEAWLKAMLGSLLDALATLHRFDCYPCNVTPDNIVLDKVLLCVVAETIGDKHAELVADGGRIVERAVDDGRRRRRCLTDGELAAVARLAKRAEKHYGCPQDVEWAMAGSDLYLLQARPETVHSGAPRTQAAPVRAGIDLSGITSMLTTRR